MARINWQDEIVEKPRTYNVINNPDGSITLEPKKGEIYQQGTPINAANLNTIGEDIEQLDTKVESHKADYVYQKAGGTATAITLTINNLKDGYPITFIASANNNGAATTINGKALYKPNTTTTPNLVAGKAYTVWYNSTNNCFFIKASAEGDASVEDVLAGKTFSNDSDTGLTGTMPNNGAISKTITTQGGQIVIPKGYHDGSGIIKAQFANLIASNIKNGVNIGGVVGIFGGNMEAYLGTTSKVYNYSSDNHYIEVPFQPETVIATIPYWNRMFFSGLDKILPTGEYSKIITYGVIHIASLFNEESDPRYKFRADGNGISYSNGKLYLKPEVFGTSFGGGSEETSKRANILALRRI